MLSSVFLLLATSALGHVSAAPLDILQKQVADSVLLDTSSSSATTAISYQYAFLPSTDISSGSRTSATPSAGYTSSSQSACASICSGDATCIAFVYAIDKAICYPLTSFSGTTSQIGNRVTALKQYPTIGLSVAVNGDVSGGVRSNNYPDGVPNTNVDLAGCSKACSSDASCWLWVLNTADKKCYPLASASSVNYGAQNVFIGAAMLRQPNLIGATAVNAARSANGQAGYPAANDGGIVSVNTCAALCAQDSTCSFYQFDYSALTCYTMTAPNSITLSQTASLALYGSGSGIGTPNSKSYFGDFWAIDTTFGQNYGQNTHYYYDVTGSVHSSTYPSGVKVTSPSACLDICSSDANCVLWVYYPNSQSCNPLSSAASIVKTTTPGGSVGAPQNAPNPLSLFPVGNWRNTCRSWSTFPVVACEAPGQNVAFDHCEMFTSGIMSPCYSFSSVNGVMTCDANNVVCASWVDHCVNLWGSCRNNGCTSDFDQTQMGPRHVNQQYIIEADACDASIPNPFTCYQGSSGCTYAY